MENKDEFEIVNIEKLKDDRIIYICTACMNGLTSSIAMFNSGCYYVYNDNTRALTFLGISALFGYLTTRNIVLATKKSEEIKKIKGNNKTLKKEMR